MSYEEFIKISNEIRKDIEGFRRDVRAAEFNKERAEKLIAIYEKEFVELEQAYINQAATYSAG